jgi:hypothetical protein
MQEEFIVFMIVDHPESMDRNYLQPVKYADGAPIQFTKDQVNAYIEDKVNRPSGTGTQTYEGGIIVPTSNMDYEEVQGFMQRMWGVRSQDLWAIYHAWEKFA